MPRKTKKVKGLTAKRVLKLIRTSASGVYTDTSPTGVRGLRLVVKNRSNCSWILRFQIDKRPRWMGLGSAKTFSLDEARKRAQEARKQLADGRDPLEAKHAQRAAERLAKASAVPTFEACARGYVEANNSEWHNPKHRRQWLDSLRDYAFPVIGDKCVDQIDTPDILHVLEQKVGAVPKRGLAAGSLWMVRRSTASRLRGRIESILGWAKVRGHRTGDNPAKWEKHLEEVLPGEAATRVVAHHEALPYAELPAFMAALRQRPGIAARAVEFLVLCASRTSEATGARWSEIDIKNAKWTIPATRMKKNIEHRVPLTKEMITLLQNLPTEEGNDFVFIGAKASAGLGTSALSDTLKRMKRGDITIHGFRSSFRDWAAEQTSVSRDVAERALAHRIGDKSSQAYERADLFDKRRKLMERWSVFCSSPPVQSKDGNVESLADARRRRRR